MDRKCARERVTGLRPTDTNLSRSEMDSDFALSAARRSNGRSSRIGFSQRQRSINVILFLLDDPPADNTLKYLAVHDRVCSSLRTSYNSL